MENNHDEINKKYRDYTNEQLYDHLKQIDEESAKILHFNNRRRVLRAIEIYEQTGQKKSEMINEQEHICLYDAYFVGLTLPRELLYERINLRVDLMMKNGLQGEMESLIKQGLTRENQSMKAIGYKEWFDYFEGKCDLNEVSENIKKHSRQYAKRQYTWFKNQFDVHWYDICLENFSKTIEEVSRDLKNPNEN